MVHLVTRHKAVKGARIQSLTFIGGSRSNVTAQARNYFAKSKPVHWSVHTYRTVVANACKEDLTKSTRYDPTV